MTTCVATCKSRLQLGRSNQPMNSARLIAMLQYSGEQNIRFDCNYITLDLYNTAQYKLHTKKTILKHCYNLVPRVLLGTKVPWWIVVTWFRFIAQILGNKTVYYCIVRCSWPEINTFYSVQTCRQILLSFPPSLKINCFIIAQNMGNKAKPRDNDPPGYFRS